MDSSESDLVFSPGRRMFEPAEARDSHEVFVNLDACSTAEGLVACGATGKRTAETVNKKSVKMVKAAILSSMILHLFVRFLH